MNTEGLSHKIDQLFRNYYAPEGPGCALNVSLGDHCIYQGVAGLQSINPKKPLTENAIFDLASCSKMMTAAAVLLLVEKQLLSLNDPISRWYDYSPQEKQRPIQVIDCLRHTSGVEDYLKHGIYSDRNDMVDSAIKTSISSALRAAVPGMAFEYSNSNFVILAEIIQQVSGQSYPDFLNEHLFHPIGVQATYQPNQNGLYINSSCFFRLEESAYMPIDTFGDGSIGMRLADAVTWFKALIKGTIINQNSLALMTQKQTLDNKEAFNYGLGMVVESKNNLKWFGHSGSWTSSTCLMGYYPQSKLVLVILSNEFMSPVERLGLQIQQLLSK